MSIEDKFGFIGWCTEGTSDKIWGYFYRPTPAQAESKMLQYDCNCCVFWGRRGKAMQFKADITGHDLQMLVRAKYKKGYNKIDQARLIEIWPTFIEEAEAKLMWDVLSGKVK